MACDSSEPGSFSIAPGEDSDSDTVLVDEVLCSAYFRVACIPSTLDPETAWVSEDQLVSSILSTWVPDCVSSLPYG